MLPGIWMMMVLWATASHAGLGTVAPSDAEACSSCHQDLARRLPTSIMAVQQLDGRHVTACIDCHPSHHAEPGTCNGELAVPRATCFGCHHDPRGLPLNPLGVVATHYGGARHADDGGLACQDCHTSDEMHGRLDRPGASCLEIRCVDCHGDLDLAPPAARDARFPPPVNGPENLVMRQGQLLTRSATGQEFSTPVLAEIARRDAWRTELGRRAMAEAAAEHASLDCMACHADWVPACHGCHGDDGGTP